MRCPIPEKQDILANLKNHVKRGEILKLLFGLFV
jgi:hypothetical protein